MNAENNEQVEDVNTDGNGGDGMDNGGNGAEPPAPYDGPSIGLVEEMKKSYLDYARSVIVSRVPPHVCDGMKPVHRRVLFAMMDGG